MLDDYKLPPAHIRSPYQVYLDEIGTDAGLSILAEEQDTKAITTSGSKFYWEAGDIFRIIVRRWDNDGSPLRIRTLKIGPGNYRFGHTIEELEAIAVLHGVYKQG